MSKRHIYLIHILTFYLINSEFGRTSVLMHIKVIVYKFKCVNELNYKFLNTFYCIVS